MASSQNAEPQKLAAFLRERCENGKYGLRYMDQEKRFIYIPWPVAPRANEVLPPGFQMFQEWAVLSFLKRNQEAPGPEKEQPTIQKHRFRNALARADGINYRKDINVDGGRIYEFTETRQVKSHPDSSYNTPEQHAAQGYDVTSMYNNYYHEDQQYLQQQYGQSSSSVHSELFGNESCDTSSVYTVSDTSSYYPPSDTSSVYPGSSVYSQNSGYPQISPRFGRPETPLWEMRSPQEPSEDLDLEQLMNLVKDPLDPDSEESHSNSPEPLRRNMEVGAGQPKDATRLVVKIRFQNHEVKHCYVTNEVGCRIFYGSNVIGCSQLLEPHHRDSLMRFCRHDPKLLFGPDILEQVKLPSPEVYISHQTHLSKSLAILNNMERGLILSIDHQRSENFNGIPDIYAMRLCQTRIFPFHETPNGSITLNLTTDSLTRMQWTKVFDAEQFLETSQKAVLLSQPHQINPTFSLSLGQRQSNNERSSLLVSLQITVQKAHEYMLEVLGANISQEVCISNVTSMDLEARTLATELNERLTLGTV